MSTPTPVQPDPPERAVPGVRTTTSTAVVDFAALGEHVAHAMSDDQAAFLVGFATAVRAMQPSPIGGEMQLRYIVDALDALDVDHPGRGAVLAVFGDLADTLAAPRVA